MKQDQIYLMIKAHLCLLLLLLNVCLPVNAKETAFHAFKKGSFTQIQQQYAGSPYIIAFWSETCAYCMQELALLGRLLKQYPEVKLVTISTDAFLDQNRAKKIIADKNLADRETWIFADRIAERLYYDVDPNWQGELPLTFFFDANKRKTKHMGVVKENELVEWLKMQTKLLL